MNRFQKVLGGYNGQAFNDRNQALVTRYTRLKKIGVDGLEDGMIAHAAARCKPSDPWRLVIGSAEHGEVYWSGDGWDTARISKADAPPDHTGKAEIEFDVSKFKFYKKIGR